MDFILLRFDSPMISFGGPMIDNNGVVQGWPAQSMIAGLIGNSMGYDHRDSDKLATLQDRLQVATRCDVIGETIVDYQTVDLGQRFMSEPGWTTWGTVEERKGGPAKTGTHIRFRHFLVDSVFTVALSIKSSNMFSDLTLDEIESSLKEPFRPLFIGRKCCIPSSPIFLGRVAASSLLNALMMAPLSRRLKAKDDLLIEMYLPSGENGVIPESSYEFSITDERDWINQIHTGRRVIKKVLIRMQNGSIGS